MIDENDFNPETIDPFQTDGLEWVNDVARAFRQPTPLESTYTVKPPSSYSRKEKGRAVIVPLSDIPREAINWLWPGRIAIGKLTLIAGDPGLGKSLLTAMMAATVSKGYAWPPDDEVSPIGSVVLLSAEDDPADTIGPRIDAAEGDSSRIHVLKAVEVVDSDGVPTQRLFSLKHDIETLEVVLAELPDCRLVIIDPISAYLDGTDSHKNADVRGLLAPLSDMAARHRVAVVLIHHLNKNGMGNALYRTMGSLAFVAAVRTAYVVTKDKERPERRLFMPTKSNIAKETSGLAYSILTSDNGAPVLAWELEPVVMTADEALELPQPDEERSETDWAISILEDLLSNGPMLVSEIKKEAKAAGIGEKALRRAREKLGAMTNKSDFKGGWVWSLPGHEDAQGDEEALLEKQGILGVEGHLRDAEDDSGANDPTPAS